MLDSLPAADRQGLEAELTIVALPAHRFTEVAGDRTKHVDFPIDAVLSVVVTLLSGDSVEVGTIGNESFVESDAVLASVLSQRTSFCQVAGTVGRMSVATFESRMATSEAFARIMRRNVRAALFSAQQFAACNSKHTILQRSARWLAMTEDRVGRTQFKLTHEFLAIMLGVRRAGVSESAEALHTMGAISYHHGDITVLDRDVLQGAACECYDACKQAFDAALRE